MAELFQTTAQNITLHLKDIFAEGELDEEATCKSYLQVRQEGGRRVTRSLRHYHLDAILSVGFRVRSPRGTQFRQWATALLREYLVKGFTMDDERLKNPPGPGHRDYFDELLERIREIRASERRFYQKVLDIYATSIDYKPDADLSQRFFATVQNKMHWATHGHTAAEIIHARADATKPFRELTFYDVQGRPVAYSTDGCHVYAFYGVPLAYLDGDSVYSFSGRHLGWLADGWIFDHHGARALFTDAAVGGPPLPEKQARRGRGFKDPHQRVIPGLEAGARRGQPSLVAEVRRSILFLVTASICRG
jgi:hypothetical protein